LIVAVADELLKIGAVQLPPLGTVVVVVVDAIVVVVAGLVVVVAGPVVVVAGLVVVAGSVVVLDVVWPCPCPCPGFAAAPPGATSASVVPAIATASATPRTDVLLRFPIARYLVSVIPLNLAADGHTAERPRALGLVARMPARRVARHPAFAAREMERVAGVEQ
jgi:hypothetical protein